MIITSASVAGAMMILQVKLLHPECHTFGDLGLKALGKPGQIWGNVIQLGNFLLFMPCALQFCALALEGIGGGISAFNGCSDYYVFVIAAVCLLSTQVRTFSNTTILSMVSVICVLAMIFIMIAASFQFEKENKVEARLFGNPEKDHMQAFVKFAGGFTINAWAYVPAFLTVELSTCMDEPRDFRKSIALSGIINILVFMVLGSIVVSRWGYDVGEVIGITQGVGFQGASIYTAFNAFQLTGNFISYMLDSVPLGRYCQKTWAPQFTDTWSFSDVLQYLGYTLPAFLMALFLAIAVPSVNTLLDFTTAFTTPWVTQIYPAVLYWKVFRRGIAGKPTLLQDSSSGGQTMTTLEKCFVGYVFLVGCVSFVLCFVKALGYIAIEDLRPPLQIGCGSWLIWKSR
jgi:hypothetical protein